LNEGLLKGAEEGVAEERAKKKPARGWLNNTGSNVSNVVLSKVSLTLENAWQ